MRFLLLTRSINGIFLGTSSGFIEPKTSTLTFFSFLVVLRDS